MIDGNHSYGGHDGDSDGGYDGGYDGDGDDQLQLLLICAGLRRRST